MEDKKIKEMKQQIKVLENCIHERTKEIFNEELGLDSKSLTISNYWECEKSPIGYCVYDNEEDYYHDDCIFCHKPEERK